MDDEKAEFFLHVFKLAFATALIGLMMTPFFTWWVSSILFVCIASLAGIGWYAFKEEKKRRRNVKK